MRFGLLILAVILTFGCKQSVRTDGAESSTNADVAASGSQEAASSDVMEEARAASEAAPADVVPDEATPAEAALAETASAEAVVVPPGESVVVEAPAKVSTEPAKDGG